MAKKSQEKSSRSIRALEILETIAGTIDALSVSDIATATGLPKATAHRLCSLLENEGFLAADVGGKGLIPSSIEGDSFRGFPSGKKSESMRRTDTEVRHGQSGCVTGRF